MLYQRNSGINCFTAKATTADGNAGSAEDMTTDVKPVDTAVMATDIKPEGSKTGGQVSWSDFSQATTCHGVRFIFTDTARIWRRILWASVVLGCLGVFAAQVTTRTVDYFKYETSTSVGVEYTDTMELPAVTLCNQNAFRISKADELGMFDFLSDYYSLDALTKAGEIRANEIPLEVADGFASDLQIALGHRLENMIERCEWSGIPCVNTSAKPFRVTLSEHTVCYTFNHGVNQKHLSVTNTEYDRLKILINTETYEHMKGYNEDSGVKIFLHAPGEIPTNNEGVVVSGGTQVNIAVSKSQTNQLPPPYGVCSTETTSSKPSCMTSCKAKMTSVTCGCAASHDHTDRDQVPCNVTQLFECVWNKDLLASTTADCDCEVPCSHTQYKPEVSTSGLSVYNIRRLIVEEDQRGRQLEQKYLTAVEARHRVVRATAQTDKNLHAAYIVSLQEAMDRLESSLTSITSPQLTENIKQMRSEIRNDAVYLNQSLTEFFFHFAEPVIALKWAIRGSAEIKAALEILLGAGTGEAGDLSQQLTDLCQGQITDQYFTSKYAERVKLIKDYLYTAPQLLDPSRPLKEPESFPETEGWSMADMSFLTSSDMNSRKRKKRAPVDPPPPGLPGSPPPPGLPGSPPPPGLPGFPDNGSPNANTEQACNSLLDKVATIIENDIPIRILSVPVHAIVKTIDSTYLTSVTDTMSITDITNGSFADIQHRQCISMLEEFQNIWLPYHDSLQQILSTDMDKIFDDFLDLVVFVDRMTDMDTFTAAEHNEMITSCFWVQEVMRLSDMIDMIGQMEQVESLFLALDNQIQGYSTNAASLMTLHLNAHAASLAETSKQHQARNITKLELARAFTDPTAVRMQTKFESVVDWVIDKTLDMLDTVTQIDSNLLKVTEYIFESDISIVDAEERLFNTWLSLHNLTGAPFSGPRTAASMKRLVNETYGKLVRDPVHVDTVKPVKSSLDALMADQAEMVQSLNFFATECEYKDDKLMENFLLVDIYFDELKTNKMTQNVSFPVLSLLGEIGGFLGLLLGASLLTLCELIDFIIMKSSSAASRKTGPVLVKVRPE